MSTSASPRTPRRPFFRLRRTGAAALTLLVATACSATSDRSAEHASVVRDSAGVQIVENTHSTELIAPPVTLSAEPLVVLRGSVDDPLFRVVSVSRTSDGGIALANASSAQLRRYDGNGTLLWSSGASGGGPGEFEQLIWSRVIPGDSLLAYDGGSRRYSLFDPEGGFVRSVQPVSADAQPISARPVGLFDDGTVLVRLPSLDVSTPTNGPLRDTARLMRLSWEGLRGDTIARVPGDERVLQMSAQSINIFTPPFASRFVAAPYGDGSVAIEAPTFELAYRNASGALQRLVRLAGVERATNDGMIDSHIARILNPRMDAAMRASTEEAMRALPRPERLPAAGQLLVDASRRVWVMDFAAPGDTATTWRLFDADGRYLGAVPIPSALTVQEIGTDWLLGVSRDADDVEEVRLYRVIAAGATAP